jgi:hypothetical protein
MRFIVIGQLMLSVAIAAGCAENPNSYLATQCENGLSVAYRELDFAKAKGFDGTVEYSKAASLLGAAKIQNSANIPTALTRSSAPVPISPNRGRAADRGPHHVGLNSKGRAW